MIHLESTPNYAGVYVTGDRNDLDELYEALHFVVGEEEEFPGYERVRLRVLAICYDMRHALMGNRSVRFVANGLDRDKMRFLSVVGSESNVYFQFEVLWPELLFVSFSLNEFIDKAVKSKQLHAWDPSIAAIRKFQAAVASCLAEVLPESKFKHVKKYMTSHFLRSFYGYTTPYIDELNIEFIKMKPEKRLAHISILVKRINEKNATYWKMEKTIQEAADKHGVPVDRIEIDADYPEEIDW